MRRWSETADRVAATTKTSEKTTILAAYLAGLTPDQLPTAAVFLTGRPFPEADQRSLGVGWSGLAGAVLRVAGAPDDALRAAYDRSSDIAAAVTEVLGAAGHAPDPGAEPSLAEVRASFDAIALASGPLAKAGILEALLSRSGPRTAGAIVKVLGGELRIGLREGLLEAAIAKAFGQPLAEVKRAGMLTGDAGRTALLALEGRLGEATLTLFHPLKFMLASPAEDAAEIMSRLGPLVWVEDKYDGIRAQLHRSGEIARLYSRDLHDISDQFPEVIEGARDLPWAGILDGEILAWKDGAVLPFLQLQARLGRKAPSDSIRAEVPVIFVAWDVLGGAAPRGRRVRGARCCRRRARRGAGSWRRSRCRSRPMAAGSRSATSPPRVRPKRWRPPSPRPGPGETRACWSRIRRVPTRRAAGAWAG